MNSMNEREQIIPSQERTLGFRELQPEEFWGGSVSLRNIKEEDFESAISQLALELQFTYSGYRSSKDLEEANYNFSRYPRRKFGPVAPIQQYRLALTKLGEKLHTQMTEEQKAEKPVLRVLLGLHEGYDKNTTLHTAQEVNEELGDGITTKPAEIYSVGPWGKYTEPAVIIECDPSQIGKVYTLAEKFHQARFAVENLQAGTSHMVETKYCTDPDKE